MRRLEDVAAAVLLPCSNSEAGCVCRFATAEAAAEHAAECGHRFVECGHQACGDMIRLHEAVAHWKEVHGIPLSPEEVVLAAGQTGVAELELGSFSFDSENVEAGLRSHITKLRRAGLAGQGSDCCHYAMDAEYDGGRLGFVIRTLGPAATPRGLQFSHATIELGQNDAGSTSAFFRFSVGGPLQAFESTPAHDAPEAAGPLPTAFWIDRRTLARALAREEGADGAGASWFLRFRILLAFKPSSGAA